MKFCYQHTGLCLPVNLHSFGIRCTDSTVSEKIISCIFSVQCTKLHGVTCYMSVTLTLTSVRSKLLSGEMRLRIGASYQWYWF